MSAIQREWLRRIGGYLPGEGPGRRPADEGGEQAEGPEEPDAPVAEGEEKADSEAAGEEREQREETERRLSIPPEVEEQRREKEEQAGRERHNLRLAASSFNLEGRYLRVLAARFARMVSKVAEDSADMPVQGDDEWDMAELRQRRFSGRLVHQCRMTREKRRVAVVLDTSPSCAHQARLFADIANVAEKLGDCDLYDAPNFAIHARKTGEYWETLPEAEREWSFRGRVVLAFGDFDGIERINRASARRGNKIYWFCCEERPQVLEGLREKFVRSYKGHYFHTSNMEGLMKAMRKVR